MSELLNTVWLELASVIQNSADMPADTYITTALKIERYDLRNLIANLDLNNSNQIKLPLVVCRFYPAEPADYGMHIEAYTQRVDIIFLDRSANVPRVTVQETSVGDVIVVANTEGLYEGQCFVVLGKDTRVIVKSIDSATEMTVTEAVSVSTGDILEGQLSTELQMRIQKIKDSLLPGGAHTSFQILEQGVMDASDINPVNALLLEKNLAILAGTYSLVLAYGQVY